MIAALGSDHIHNNKYCKKYKDGRFENLSKILNTIKRELKKLGVEVVRPKKSAELCRSLWLRDTFVNINNKLYLLPKSYSNYRRPEEELKTLNLDGHMLDLYMDGGDLIQENNNMFLGIGKRTDISAYNGLKEKFPKKNIIKINHTALHLDCCFCVLPKKNIVYSTRYIKSLPTAIRSEYNVRTVEEFIGDSVNSNLATNVLIIKNTLLAIDMKKFSKLYDYFESLGLNVVTIPFYNLWKDGGGIRCLTQWIDKSKLRII